MVYWTSIWIGGVAPSVEPCWSATIGGVLTQRTWCRKLEANFWLGAGLTSPQWTRSFMIFSVECMVALRPGKRNKSDLNTILCTTCCLPTLLNQYPQMCWDTTGRNTWQRSNSVACVVVEHIEPLEMHFVKYQLYHCQIFVKKYMFISGCAWWERDGTVMEPWNDQTFPWTGQSLPWKDQTLPWSQTP